MLLIVVTISHYIHTSNDYVVHLKVIQWYINYIAIKLERKRKHLKRASMMEPFPLGALISIASEVTAPWSS